MWNQKGCSINNNVSTSLKKKQKKNGGERKVGVAIAKNKGSKGALKWALDNILRKTQTVRLIHVNHTNPSSLPNNGDTTPRNESSDGAVDLFLPFRCFCSRRQVLWETVTLEEQDIAKALIDYVCSNRLDTLVLSAPARSSITRLFKTDIPSMVLKGAPSFCNIYIISKGKVASFRHASDPISKTQRLERQRSFQNITVHNDLASLERTSNVKIQDEWSMVETDQSSPYTPQGRMSTESSILSFYNNLSYELEPTPRSFSVGSRKNFDPLGSKSHFSDIDPPIETLSSSLDKENKISPCSTPNNEELEEKMRRLELQMKQTMDMYHAACKEALTAKQKAREFQVMKIETDKKLVESEMAKQAALAATEEEKEKRKVAYKLAKSAYRKVEKEKQKKEQAEVKASEEAKNNMMLLESVNQSHVLLLRQQSLLHIVIVFFFFYVYFSKLF